MTNRFKLALFALCVAATFVGPAVAATINDSNLLTGYTPYNIAYEIYDNGLGINADAVPVYIHNTAPMLSGESENLRVFNGKVNLSGQKVMLLAPSTQVTATVGGGSPCDTALPAGEIIIGESDTGAVPSEDVSINIYGGTTFCLRNGLAGGQAFTVGAGAATYIAAGLGNVDGTTGLATIILADALNFNVNAALNPACGTPRHVQLAYISNQQTAQPQNILVITPQFTGSQIGTALNAELNTDTDFMTFKLFSGPYVVDANNIFAPAFTINNLQAATPIRWKAWVAATNIGAYTFQLNSTNPEPSLTITAGDNGFAANCAANTSNTAWTCGQTGQAISAFTAPPGWTSLGIRNTGAVEMNPTIWSITNATITISGGTRTEACFAPSGPIGGLNPTYHTLNATKSGLGSGTLSASGLLCGSVSCSGTYSYGTVVNVFATPVLGSAFAGWTGCDSVSANTCTVTMTGGKSIRAIFTLFPPPANFFTDVPAGYWAGGYINAICNAGYTTGYDGTDEFKPEYEVTREQMAAFIIRAAEGEPATGYCSTGSPFPDCSADSWSCKYIKRLFDLGLTAGYGTSGLYMPYLFVTRAQVAAFIVRAVEGEPAANYCLSGVPFTDVPASDWSCGYIKRLSELGITTGYGDGRYGPDDPVTRAQMAVFLGRAFLGME